MRRFTFFAVLCLLVCGAGLYIGRQYASASTCFTIDACGYYTDKLTTAANFNVLPGSALAGVTNAAGFINTISNDLYSSDTHSHMGAAYIVDAMLNYRGTSALPAGGGVAAGVSYARNNFGTWKALVNYYANSSSPSVYGITWAYWPSEQTFCGAGGKPDSAYDDGVTPPTHGTNDVAVYKMPAYGTQGCTAEWNSSMPEIHFHWKGGSFDIGTLCGNLQDTIDAIPSDRLPTGTLTLNCVTGQETASITFKDPDAPTSATLDLGSWHPTFSASPQTVILPTPPRDPYNSQVVALRVLDTGPLAPPNTYVTVTAKTVVPCAAVACGSLTVTPLPLDPYMKYSVEVSATNNVNQAPPGAKFSVVVKNPGGGTAFSGSQAASGAGGLSTATFSNLGPANAAGVYTVDWQFTASGINLSCSGTFPVVYLPYLNVYGGDVSTGSVAANGDGTTCAIGAAAGIFSWNNHSTNFSGAGAQYAVQAIDTITDFASSLSSTNTAPLGLAMANTWDSDPTKQDSSQGLFGGFFGSGTPNCDLTSDLSGVTAKTTNYPIGGQTINGNNDIVYVKNADVYISGNIIYAGSGAWANMASIPYFKLVVVGGNIYINPNVTELDGIYVAEPSGASGAGGRIYTCATGFGAPVDPASPGSYTLCNRKLTVYGAFAAASVQFGRTSGSVGQADGDTLANNHDAEVFDYTPEIWLPRGAAQPGNGYNAITGLPPVL